MRNGLRAMVIVVGALFATIAAASADVRYVSMTGSDSNPGTLATPYLTIQKCATTVASGSSCLILGGTYRETVTPNSGITIAPYNGATVTIDGSDPVTVWKLHKGNIYQAHATLSSDDTNQVFVGQTMMTEARWPNGDDLFHPVWATLQTGTTVTQLVDSNLPNVDWTGAVVHFWSGDDPYSTQTALVKSSSRGKLTFQLDSPTHTLVQPQPGGYYYVFGTLAGLDTQNEWAYDSSSQILYFWAPGGVNPSSLDVRAKRRLYGFDLSGKSHVTIQGIHLFATTINSDASSTNDLIDGITATYVSQYTRMYDSIVANVANTGIIIGGSKNIIRNSVISYSSGDGVALVGEKNVIRNNLIHHINYMANYAAGISILNSYNIIQNNTIHSSGRFLIFYGGTRFSNVDISYNNLSGAMMLSRDGGSIYTDDTPASSVAIHHNWIHDNQSLYPGPAYNYPMSGVYIDDDSRGWDIYQNVIWNIQYQSIFLHGGGIQNPNNNLVENNSVIDINPNSYIALSEIPHCGTTAVIRNFVLVQPVQGTGFDHCAVSSNGPTAPGANQMTPSVQVGCNFAGCTSEGPPKVCGKTVAASIATQPYDMTVTQGASATFTVTGAGSPMLKYQWQKSGKAIPGATQASYTIAKTALPDSGEAFSVSVANSCGRVASDPAVLTVRH